MTFKKVLLLGLVAILCAVAVITYMIYDRNYNIWLYDYTFNSPSFSEPDSLTDIIFVVVDHWEPGGNIDIVNTWMKRYRELADKHIDADGVKLQHTFFYPIEQFRGYEVDSLVKLCSEGYGEIEVHLHHKEDNSASLREKLIDGIDSLRAHGALISSDSNVFFGFIHGNWALDNSRFDRNLCGVDDEISILLDLGCYADFTFPALGQTAQPSLVNKIYYAFDNPNEPKSYDTGTLSRVGLTPTTEQLMIMEGPMMINWSDWRFKTHPTFDDGNLFADIPTSFERFELWVKANVHVRGKPNWVFVRPFTHGAYLRDGAEENVLGSNIDQMLNKVEKKYNDGKKFRLHYMTAREAYNVIKAAEAGLDGNPNQYRDYILPKYIYPVDSTAEEAL